jgi:hypothetical protein
MSSTIAVAFTVITIQLQPEERGFVTRRSYYRSTIRVAVWHNIVIDQFRETNLAHNCICGVVAPLHRG